MIFTALKCFSFSSGSESSATLFFPAWQNLFASVTNQALASLQNVAQGSNSLQNHSRPTLLGTRHTHYTGNPFIHAVSLIFPPFLIPEHFFRASIRIHTCLHNTVYGGRLRLLFSFLCWFTPSVSLEISLRLYYWARIQQRLCNCYKHSNCNLKKVFNNKIQ